MGYFLTINLSSNISLSASVLSTTMWWNIYPFWSARQGLETDCETLGSYVKIKVFN